MVPFHVLFQRVEIGAANSLAGFGVMGYPALTAFHGLAQVVARAIAGEEQGRHLHRFAVIHHTGQARLHGQYRDKPTQKRTVHTDSDKPPKGREQYWFSPSEEIRPLVDLTVSLLLESRISAERAAFLQAQPEQLTSCLGQRALGGVIRGHGKILLDPDPLT
ncbi:MAG: hypothetical protein HQL64_09600, partial [Magnetococcales bacterium]|nr:hypothetical protein [Magnetococcales bacterium]